MDDLIDPQLAAGPLKLRAMSLELEGRLSDARTYWLKAASLELQALRALERTLRLQDASIRAAAFRRGVGEVAICLASACRPLLKERARSIVKQFLDRAFGKEG